MTATRDPRGQRETPLNPIPPTTTGGGGGGGRREKLTAGDLVPAEHKHIARLAYSIDEILEAVPLSRNTVKRMIASGELRSVTIRRRRLVPADALHELLEGRAS